jgi:hypothetical protein
MAPRYVIRRDAAGFTVADAATGEAVVIAMTAQTGLSAADAQHTADLLNHRAMGAARAANG